MRNLRDKRQGVTLIEVLILVVILGILSSVVLPQMTASATSPRESTLRAVHAQLQAKSISITMPIRTAENVVDQLIEASNSSGTTVPAGNPYGPC